MNAPLRPSLKTSIAIDGMTCASCVSHVEHAIEALPQVETVSVNLATERAEVTFRDRQDLGAVRAAVEAAGYSVVTETAEFDIDGMHCASCVQAVETALEALPGVTNASVNLATSRATVTRLAGAAPDQRLVAAIASAGYSAERHADDTADRDFDRRDAAVASLRRRAIVAAALALPVIVLAMGPHLITAMHHWLADTFGAKGSGYIQLALTMAILMGPGLPFFTLGIRSLARLRPDMNALVAIGTGAAFFYSAVATVVPSVLPAGTAGVYFEAAALIVTLILLGRYLEARARGQASEAISRLVRLAPKTARIERNGLLEQVPIERLVVGDVIQVQPGERIAVDGLVLDGSSHVDESILTGEPMPVAKQAGSAVVGGSINQAGVFSFRATKVGAETMLASIIRMVEGAQATKLPIQAIVDRVTAWFVPAVIGIAVMTFILWLAFGPDPALGPAVVAAVAVLIIACPCAMGLATPISILVGTGRAAELGVLFRRGDALQSLSSVGVIALDKTGTLTIGRPALTDIVLAEGFLELDVLALAASAESRSEHPLAKAIVDAATDRGISIALPDHLVVEPGLGLHATVGARDVAIGNRHAMDRFGVDIAPLSEHAGRLADQGKTSFYVAMDGRLAAVLAVSDPIKPRAAAAIALLKAEGLRVAMITGDNERTARTVATAVGIDEVVANVDPAGKLAAIRSLMTGGVAVAFVGDGINDAPALAEANVGIAMGTGTDVAIEAADVVLATGNLGGVADAVALSRATLRNIRQNLFWAFAYNAALIPIAAGVLYPLASIQLTPVLAAAAMALSSVFVVANALRLRAVGGPAWAPAPRRVVPATATARLSK